MIKLLVSAVLLFISIVSASSHAAATVSCENLFKTFGPLIIQINKDPKASTELLRPYADLVRNPDYLELGFEQRWTQIRFEFSFPDLDEAITVKMTPVISDFGEFIQEFDLSTIDYKWRVRGSMTTNQIIQQIETIASIQKFHSRR